MRDYRDSIRREIDRKTKLLKKIFKPLRKLVAYHEFVVKGVVGSNSYEAGMTGQLEL